MRGHTAHGEFITRFAYDALGRRIAKTVRSTQDITGNAWKETRFIWQGLRLLQEIHQDTVSSYVYSPDHTAKGYTPLARLDQILKADQSLSEGTLYYFHTDHIGTPQEVTTEDGKLVWAGQYSAWGKLERQVLNAPVELAADFTQNLRFAGQYFDESVGLHYNTYRYYDQEVGRFISRDPIGLAGGANLYQYASNPTKWIDPLGLAPYPWGSDFGTWFNNASHEDVASAMQDNRLKRGITTALRGEGGMHEWFPVSMADKAKSLGFTYEELMKMSTPKEDVYFKNIPDPHNPGSLLEGPHSTGKALPSGQSSRASVNGHNILMRALARTETKSGAIKTIKNFAEKFVRGGKNLTKGFSC